jgi:aminoglycoside 6-adenylyltransferase
VIIADSNRLLASIIAWAEGDANVRALIMTGSRARIGAAPDEFSDFDIEIVADRPDVLTGDDAWFRSFGRVWVHLPTVIGPGYETRLVFYEGGMKVDFSLCGRERVDAMVAAKALDDLYERGYRVLADKDGMTAGLPGATGAFPAKERPDQAEFAATVEEFWFEAAHIPRYILRGELWVVKFRDWTMKEMLLRVLEWHAAALSEHPVDVWHIGTHMSAWVDEETRRELRSTFAVFDEQSSWRALLATTSLFRRLATETAEALGLRYPAEADEGISGYLDSFRDRMDALDSPPAADP